MKLKAMGIIVFSFLIVFSGCKSNKGVTEIGYDVSGPIGSLDPQFIEESTGKLVLANVLEGLVVKTPTGEILPGVAEFWEVSPDGKTYTFTLGEKIFWEKTKDFEKLELTGEDFVFAFQRLFSENTSSAQVSPFFSLVNGETVFRGESQADELGVTSPSKNKVVFTLEYPDTQFLDKLALPQALPCNELFFKSTKGRYGMGRDFILANGPFTIAAWAENDRLTLVRNTSYHNNKEVYLETVYLFMNREDHLKRFEDDITHVLKVDTVTGEKLKEKGMTLLAFPDKVWSLGFQGGSDIWGIPYFRQALSYTVNRTGLEDGFPQGYKTTSSFLPNKTNGKQSYNSAKGKEAYNKGLELLEIDRVPTATIYTPKNMDYDEILLPLQETWKEDLNLYISFSQVEEGIYDSLRQSDDFEIILFPSSITSNPEEMLSTFVTGNKDNTFSYNNEVYNGIVKDISNQKDEENVWNKARQGENLLLSDVVIIPLYTQESYYSVNGFSGEIDIYPHEGIIRFHSVSLP